ncbi:carbamoyltransferase [Adhaeribacter aerolatus]|uniref:Carbamoyltransferase n=1 Tax=Adhaeribacter aerolatus TaxID=670289 RepID=A0A512B3B4_9BACT|nr:carbamoyltransferase N-terminal domain-containing protein [Adhaeribacter aerolatus]GEO06448.1 carbamoyltransferase [Adhaeribacter aerolatus]
MNIIGISAFHHDSAAALLQQGQIIAAAQEERFTRRQHDSGFPVNALKYCLNEANLQLKDIEAVAFYNKPYRKLERLLKTYYTFAPFGWQSFLRGMPGWLKEKLFLQKLLRKELSKIDPEAARKVKILFPEQHLSQAAGAFYPSGLAEAAILTVDSVGEWATTSLAHGRGKEITVLQELHFPHSVGLLYAAITDYLGFKVNAGEAGVMNLAAYGNPQAENTKNYIRLIKRTLVQAQEDGSIWLNQKYFSYATGRKILPDAKWQNLFGFPRRLPAAELEQKHCDLALAIQTVTEEIMLKLAREVKKLTGATDLCLAGGVAMNSAANGKLQNSSLFRHIFIQPAASDAGGAIGAALAAHYLFFNQERIITPGMDALQGAYLGPAFPAWTVAEMIRKYGAVADILNEDDLTTRTAALLAAGNIIGWFQGRMEFGLQALGNRSMLADPRNPDMQKKLNLNIKFRESFRPFAVAVLAEDASQYFHLTAPSPYRLLTQTLKPTLRRPLPKKFHLLSLAEKLNGQYSIFPVITHANFSACIQTVHPETNPLFRQLLQAFKKLTGYGLLVNTSFRGPNEPMVGTPAEAYACFMRTPMDYLVIGDYLFTKAQQPPWPEKPD